MSYLKSGFIPLSRPMPFQFKNGKGPFYEKSGKSIKSTKDNCLYHVKGLKQENEKELYKANKTPPLVLFINLLMKDGKKTIALRVLSFTLSLFKARISKIKLQTNFSSLKKRNFYQYFYNPGKTLLHASSHTCHFGANPELLQSSMQVDGGKTRGNAFGTPFASSLESPLEHYYDERKITGLLDYKRTFKEKNKTNYSIKNSLFAVFSKKKTQSKNKKAKLLLNVAFPWFFNYRKNFPFIFHFSKLFDYFYKKKRFFFGKFRNLRQFPIINKNLQQSNLMLFAFVKNKEILFKKNKGDNFESNFNLYYFANKNKTLPVSFQEKESNSKKCVWYKNLAKKPSWDKLTSAQKTSFLFCLYKAISNVKPPLECRTKRIGGSNKQIPSQVSEHRQWGIAIRWIIEVAKNEFSKKKNKINLYKPNNRFISNNLSSTSRNSKDNFKNLGNLAALKKNTLQEEQSKSGSWGLDYKTRFLSSLKQETQKSGGLKVHCPKTKFYSFCFFLAESLEGAYYKTGPAMQKRNLWVETALANRAFLRYRWW